MAKKIITNETEEIRKAVEAGSALIGTETTLKELKKGNLSKIFLSNNCPEEIKEDVSHYAGLGGTEVVTLSIPNVELGVVCKKPFSVSILGLKK